VKKTGNQINTDPREKTLDILELIENTSTPLDALIDKRIDQPGFFAPRDRSFFNVLLFGILRWRGRLDWTIGHFSKTPLRKIDPLALNILRLGLYQAAYLDRVPVSAAVNTSVEIAKYRLAPHITRFINAVLRKAANQHHEVLLPDEASDPVLRIAVEHSFPEWMIRRWHHRFGYDTTRRICNAMNQIPEITLRANTLKSSRVQLFRELTDWTDRLRLTRHSPFGVSISGPRTPIASLPVFSDGWFQVQDEAAQLVSFLTDPKPGEKILDACCGLGGKTGHLAQMMRNQGCLHAIDVEASKLARLRSETARLGIGIVDTIPGNLCRADFVQQLGHYDRILIDAPCSGMGVVRRNPDIKWKRMPMDPAKHQKNQLALLDSLGPHLKIGGRLVFSVCSMETEENEQVIMQFLKKHPEFAIEKPPVVRGDFLNRFTDREGYLRTFPTMDGMDGFFAVRLCRKN
jgi:16S rRNA (cytosine967-C5)-methyltransferase